MAREPFVSGVYRTEEDAQNRPRPSIKKIVNDAKKAKKVRTQYGAPITEASIALTKRITGDRDE